MKNCLLQEVKGIVVKSFPFHVLMDPQEMGEEAWKEGLFRVMLRSKNRFCRAICLVFVFVHTRSYVCMRHQNFSGSFETPSSKKAYSHMNLCVNFFKSIGRTFKKRLVGRARNQRT
jgi:hypothetical protein